MDQNIIKIEATAPALALNYEAAKAAIQHEVARYDVVVTQDTVKDAKKLATELRQSEQFIRSRGKEAVDEVSAPIREFQGQIKELSGICADGRQRILNQVQKFEDETRELARGLLETLRAELWEQSGVESEFRGAEVDDLVKLTSVTGAGRLAASARGELVSRVQADLAKQQTVRTRLLELENACYKAGLHAPLQRQHVERILFAPDEQYRDGLQRLIDSELSRQEETERRVREAERRRVEQEQARAEEAQRRQQRQEAAQAKPEEKPAESAGGQSGTSEPKPEPKPQPQAADSAERVEVEVIARFRTSCGPGVPDEAIITECRKAMARAGITTLAGVEVRRIKQEATQ